MYASKVCGVQVESNPKQEGAVNCGIFAGLQAEVLSEAVVGRVRMHNGGLVCDAEDPNVLQRRDIWFSENDVLGARLLCRAAALAFWTAQSPSDDATVKKDLENAEEQLAKAWLTPAPTRDQLWCDF